VPSLVHVKARLGSVDLDLTDADLSRGETVIEVSAVLGSITLFVPEGLAVECEGSALLGSFDHVAAGPASRKDTRVVRIVGKATLGSVEIVVKKRSKGVVEDLKQAVRGLLGG
jgi:predicted membrane protein